MVQINWDAVLFAALGGVLLGVATSINYIIRGKVTGMSGIVFGVVSLNKSQMPEKLSIIGGMFLISGLFYLIFGEGPTQGGFLPFGKDQLIAYWTTYIGFFVSGFLVGFGTKLGNGCTSGHGLCGLSRFSLRSFVAVGVFLLTAIAISNFANQIGLPGLVDNQDLSPYIQINHNIFSIIFIVVGILLPLIGYQISRKNGNEGAQQIKDQIIVMIVGIIFAIGLMVSGMSRRSNILGFLQFNENWNPALLFVLGCGVTVNLVTFTIMRKRGTSINGNKVFDPQNNTIDWQLVLGAFCFGLGWGIGGLCPGPFLVLFAAFTVPIQLLWGVGLVIGMLVAKHVGQVAAAKKKRDQEGETSKERLI